jgi:hypothetical protein
MQKAQGVQQSCDSSLPDRIPSDLDCCTFHKAPTCVLPSSSKVQSTTQWQSIHL